MARGADVFRMLSRPARILGWTRFLAIAGVLCSLVAGTVGFVWGVVRAVELIWHTIHGEELGMSVELVKVMDNVLIGAALLIFGLGIYELFVGDLELPQGLRIETIDDLKSKLAAIVALVASVTFLERLELGGDPIGIACTGVTVALFAAVLFGVGLRKQP
jgi:uncharacterized membrane protein YqhA